MSQGKSPFSFGAERFEPLDEACDLYRRCLQMLRDGRCQEVADLLASLEEHEPRYARDVATRLDVAKRWLDAGDSPAAKADFWEWMDREG